MMKKVLFWGFNLILGVFIGCDGGSSPETPTPDPLPPNPNKLSIQITANTMSDQVIKRLVPLNSDEQTPTTPSLAAVTNNGLYLLNESDWLISTTLVYIRLYHH